MFRVLVRLPLLASANHVRRVRVRTRLIVFHMGEVANHADGVHCGVTIFASGNISREEFTYVQATSSNSAKRLFFRRLLLIVQGHDGSFVRRVTYAEAISDESAREIAWSREVGFNEKKVRFRIVHFVNRGGRELLNAARSDDCFIVRVHGSVRSVGSGRSRIYLFGDSFRLLICLFFGGVVQVGRPSTNIGRQGFFAYPLYLTVLAITNDTYFLISGHLTHLYRAIRRDKLSCIKSAGCYGGVSRGRLFLSILLVGPTSGQDSSTYYPNCTDLFLL